MRVPALGRGLLATALLALLATSGAPAADAAMLSPEEFESAYRVGKERLVPELRANPLLYRYESTVDGSVTDTSYTLTVKANPDGSLKATWRSTENNTQDQAGDVTCLANGSCWMRVSFSSKGRGLWRPLSVRAAQVNLDAAIEDTWCFGYEAELTELVDGVYHCSSFYEPGEPLGETFTFTPTSFLETTLLTQGTGRLASRTTSRTYITTVASPWRVAAPRKQSVHPEVRRLAVDYTPFNRLGNVFAQ